MDPLVPSAGWGVLHLFFSTRGSGRDEQPGAAKEIIGALADFSEDDDHQVLVFAVLGHHADVGVMAIGPDLVRLRALQQRLAVVMDLNWSYFSITEVSEYGSTEGDERARLEDEGLAGQELDVALEQWRDRIAGYRANKLHPRLPARRFLSFYPMSKRRDGGDNWYALDFSDRKQLMAGHARVGRTYAGRVLQLITASTGLDDWEWGVTLLADDPVAIKEIVYEMRFDEVSARYAEFGPFITGLIGDPESVLESVGLSS